MTGPPLLAAALAAVAWAVGVKGTDQAAQTFWVLEVRQHGLSLFNSAWYGGVYPLSYSAGFPVLGALIGLAGCSVVMSALATWAFDRLTVDFLGRRTAGSWYFAVSSLLQVAIGQMPFLCGEAFGLAAVLALTHRRRGLALALGVASALCSPLAAAFLAMACLAWGWRSRGANWWPVWLAVLSMVIVGGVSLAFPGDGYFPFPWTELVMIELLCLAVASPLVRTTPAVRVAVGIYAVASLASFAVPNPLGGNAGRLATAVGIPLLACFVTAPEAARFHLSLPRRVAQLRHPLLQGRWQRYAGVVLLPFAVWQWAPGVTAVASSHSDPSTNKAFYQPLLARLGAHNQDPQRIEIVPTAEHWEAAFVATKLSLARGWERQIDTARNPLFYQPGLLNAASYQQWLVANGIRWVALPNAPLDYAGKAEAQLVRSGAVADLAPVWHDANWRLWQVTDSPGLVSGPAHLTMLAPDHLTLSASAPGTVTVRVRWSPYWTFTAGTGCVAQDPQGWTVLRVASTGTVQLSAQIGASRGPACPQP
ncbi:hypothetical protein K6U06_13230 [Acidiferrimicrobium sp. IK]|uniref:hypothetical protein n=1 Tax=Acidiferrimicrobium sp. IK TaxID=2871700 RepID=UPI0021CB2256|nr:hypothetical protein [Acidiferrimicrobium sp. IK]MCU4185330.1 hypothetical protein [Acidiferrimicrobium sp. IK]